MVEINKVAWLLMRECHVLICGKDQLMLFCIAPLLSEGLIRVLFLRAAPVLGVVPVAVLGIFCPAGTIIFLAG
jgi:hypothetical protein